MISDVLFDAMEDIRRYQREMPDVYGAADVKPHIDELIGKMDEVRKVLDEVALKRLGPERARELKEAMKGPRRVFGLE